MTDRPTCPLCCKPLANQVDFDTVPENEGQDLCWAAFGECECAGQEPQIIAELRAENAELRAIVAKLPKTADGVHVCIGDEVFYPGDPIVGYVTYSDDGFEIADGDDTANWVGLFFDPSVPSERWWTLNCCYSTPEAAAEAAKGHP